MGYVYRNGNAHLWGMFSCTDVGMRIWGYVFLCRPRNSWCMFLCIDLGMRIRGVCVQKWKCAFVGYVSVYRSWNAHSLGVSVYRWWWGMFLCADLEMRIRGVC